MIRLRLKLVGYVLFVATLLAVGTAKMGLDAQHALLRARLASAHGPWTSELAASLAGPLESHDSRKILHLLKAALDEPAVVRIVVEDAEGRAVAREPGIPRRDLAFAQPGDGWAARVWTAADPLLRAAFPPPVVEQPIVLGGREVGVVRVQLMSGEAGAVVVGAARAAIWGWLALSILLAVATYSGAGRIARPLAEMRDLLRRMGSGDAAPGRRGGRGVREFVEMVGELRAASQRVRELSEQLEQLNARTTFIQDVIQSMADTLIVVDQQARIKAVNQATKDLLGFTEQELIGRTASLICVVGGRHLTAETLEVLLGQESKRDHEVVYVAKDGRRVPISLSGSVIRDANGSPTGYVCIGTDISERKAAEAEREQLNRQLVRTSRQAGMAEVATGVLHNVGNVLNSVNVSATLVEETLRKSRVPHLGKLAELLAEHGQDLGTFLTSDERGRVVPAYISQLAEHMSEEHGRLVGEISALTKHIAHIKDIISVQQAVARPAGVIETVDVRELVEDALRMIGDSLQRHGIKVERQYADVQPVRTDKHKVLQILVNVLGNAKDAIKECSVREGVLTLRVAQRGAGGVRVEVADNGVGIEPENLTKVFTHGFTTKKQGHGFGLHASANSAKELHGSLTARSDGRGTGATFVLDLPEAAVEEVRSA